MRGAWKGLGGPTKKKAAEACERVPDLLNALVPLQDTIAARCRTLPGALMQQLTSIFDDFEPNFSLAGVRG